MFKPVSNQQSSTELQAHVPAILRKQRTSSRKVIAFGLTLILVIFLASLIGSTRSQASVANIFKRMVQSGNPIDQSVVVEAGPNASIWSTEPMLTEFPDQEYQGRLVVEIWTKGEYIFYPSDKQGNPVTGDFLERTIAALDDPQTEILTATPWTDEPVMATSEDIPGERFLGRVVVEVWDEQIVVAATGSEPPASLTQRAIVAIDGQLQ